MKKLEIKKTKPTFIISTFKTDMIKVGLVFSISNFFIAKTSLANNWRSFSSSYLALELTKRVKLQSLAGMSSNCSIDPLNWTNFLLYYVYAGLVHIRPRQTLWHSLMLTKSIFIDFALWDKNYRFFKLKTV